MKFEGTSELCPSQTFNLRFFSSENREKTPIQSSSSSPVNEIYDIYGNGFSCTKLMVRWYEWTHLIIYA